MKTSRVFHSVWWRIMADVWLQDGAHDCAESSDPFPGEAASFLELHPKPLLIRHGRGPFPAAKPASEDASASAASAASAAAAIGGPR